MWRVTVLSVCCLILSVQSGQAQWAVYDAPASAQRNLIWLEETAQWAKSIAQEVQTNVNLVNQYIQDAKAYVSLPQATVAEIQGLSQGYLDLLNQGQSLGFSLQQIGTQFDQLFGQGAFQGDALAYAQKVAASIRESSRLGAQAASLFQQLCLTKNNKERQLQLSRASIGDLSVSQAGNELMGTMIDQAATLQTLQATGNRLQQVWVMKQIVEEEATAQKAAHWMDGWPQPGPTERVRIPGAE
jgi:P-type conjugative transfer protein TrbJ